MKKSKKNYLIILLVVLLLTVAVGYAVFSQTLNIAGTATANGTFDVHFASTVSVDEDTGADVVATVVDDYNMTVTADLSAPGVGAEITAAIENAGSVDAKLTAFTVTGAGFTGDGSGAYTDGTIIVTVPVLDTTGSEVIAVSGSKNFMFNVEWDPTATVSGADHVATFTISFTYEQDV